jgi:hypothetical protein
MTLNGNVNYFQAIHSETRTKPLGKRSHETDKKLKNYESVTKIMLIARHVFHLCVCLPTSGFFFVASKCCSISTSADGLQSSFQHISIIRIQSP